MVDAGLERTLERRKGHRLGHCNVLVQQTHVLIDPFQDTSARVSIRFHYELYVFPSLGHLVQCCLDTEFLASLFSHLFNCMFDGTKDVKCLAVINIYKLEL